jgi:hypothetical protein
VGSSGLWLGLDGSGGFWCVLVGYTEDILWLTHFKKDSGKIMLGSAGSWWIDYHRLSRGYPLGGGGFQKRFPWGWFKMV